MDWWSVSTPEMPDHDSQRKVVQAGGLQVRLRACVRACKADVDITYRAVVGYKCASEPCTTEKGRSVRPLVEVIIAHVVDASTSPLIRSEAVRALWCMLVENPGIASEAMRGGAGAGSGLINSIVHMAASAPAVAKAAAVGVIGRARCHLPVCSC